MVLLILFTGLFQKAEFPMDKSMAGDAMNRFGIELMKRIDGDGNVFISPYSIYTALGMVYEGAHGKTEDEMRAVMGITGSDFSLALYSLEKDIRRMKGASTIEIANSLWLQKSFPVLPSFREKMRKYYGGEFYLSDFITAPEKERQRINRWVEEKTHEKIKELFPPNTITDATKLVLVNAIYFLGKWDKPFDTTRTKNEKFNTGDGMVEAFMMNNTSKYHYGEFDGFKALRMYYGGGEFFMLVLLPDSVNGVKELEEKLSAELIDSVNNSLKWVSVNVSIPRFTLDNRYRLNRYLKAMGMKTAFSTAADFSGITGKRDLFISLVIHRAYINVYEEGTEAAAATGVAMDLTAVRPEKIYQFRADHPFLFFIIHKNTGAILFAGRLSKPETKEE